MQKNRFEVAGYLAAKPELRYLPSGTKVANARLGETYGYLQENKERTHTNWHRLTFYGELADMALLYEQGDNLFVEGSIQQRQFTSKDGSQRTLSEVIVKSSHVIEPRRGAGSAPTTESDTTEREEQANDVTEALEHDWPRC